MASESHNRAADCYQDIVGSQYALEVAFQTMKERCRRLQQRLAKVEEENSKLRLQRRKEEVISSSRGYEEVEAIQDTVSELERQKKQLAHHVLMVTSENKQLWTRLSQSAKLNKSLGSQLTKISETLNCHSTTTKVASQQSSSSPMIHRSGAGLGQLLKGKEPPSTSENASELQTDSLVEISLKLINSLQQEKTELEDQCAQMTQLREDCLSPTFSADHLGFSMGSAHGFTGEDGELLDPILVPEVQHLRDSLLSMKQELLTQQENMKASVANLLKFRDSNIKCHTCLERAKRNQDKVLETASKVSNTAASRFESANIAEPESLGDSADEEIKEQLLRISEESNNGSHSHPAQNDRVCPICGRLYPCSTPFEDFHRHVVDHFEDSGVEEYN